jgi:hypothetical protein
MPADPASLVDGPCLTRQQIVPGLTGREQTLARGSTVRMWITGASLCRAFRGQRSFFREQELPEKEIRQLLLSARGQIDCKVLG